MARSGLGKSDVREARERLLAQGKTPSVDAVRVELGNTGSKTTIHRHLKELERETAGTRSRQMQTGRELQDLVERLAARLHVEADARIDEIHAAQEVASRHHAEEMAVVKKTLEERDVELEALRRQLLQSAGQSEALLREVHALRIELAAAETRLETRQAQPEPRVRAEALQKKPEGQNYFDVLGGMFGGSRNADYSWGCLNTSFP